MTQELDCSVVRIGNADGVIFGTGFLVSDKFVLTCAHVIARALGLPETTPEPSQDDMRKLRLDFPLIPSHDPYIVGSAFWLPLQPDGTGDIAGLELKSGPPEGAHAVRLVMPRDVWKHAFRAFGFPEEHPNGVWAYGVLLGPVAPQATGRLQGAEWLQIEDTKDTGYCIQPGFSGGPVWDEQERGVVGMVVAAEERSQDGTTIRAAFIIRTAVLVKEWPALADRVSVPTLLIGNLGQSRSTYLLETIDVYLDRCLKDDRFARLEQAGETDPERLTLLRDVFIDLLVSPRTDVLRLDNRPRHQDRLSATRQAAEGDQRIIAGQSGAGFSATRQAAEDPAQRIQMLWRQHYGRQPTASAMEWLLQERSLCTVLIGGPGQGKTTLGQYVSQVHRATLLRRHDDIQQPGSDGIETQQVQLKTPRIPFRIILRDFAQWLSRTTQAGHIEAYLAAELYKATSRNVEVEEMQELLRARPSLIIFDGLDEVSDQESPDKSEPSLRSAILTQVQQFLDRAVQLEWKLQVLATSRPTRDTSQFSPDVFVHLELEPLSSSEVREYAQRWVHAKSLTNAESTRVLDTLTECVENEHIHLLLTTPLQVTIVLLIIKDGGYPPSQREALFNEYWGTILRREKAKKLTARGFIPTDETMLVDLHAYLGYILHKRAAGEHVRTVLSEVEFTQTVYDLLRDRDSRSSDAAIMESVTQLVTEAKDRLVLLVEPEPGLFGFEIRSLQEFFAAVHLAQSAKDTHERFTRLKAIARSEHWHNVALFFAGRIVRSFGGEASSILELVCRAIDRDPRDRFLRRGAWLALDIAADGIFAASPDLKYSALEYAMTLLGNGKAPAVTIANQERLRARLQHLSPEDHRDILVPILTEKMRALPLACLPQALSVCADVLAKLQLMPAAGGDQRDALVVHVREALDRLLTSEISMYVRAALDEAHRPDLAPYLNVPWLAQHVSTWLQRNVSRDDVQRDGHGLLKWWTANPDLVETVLLACSLNLDDLSRLMTKLMETEFLYAYGLAALTWDLPSVASDSSYHVITVLRLLNLLRTEFYSVPATVSFDRDTRGTVMLRDIRATNAEPLFEGALALSQNVSELLERRDLPLQVRACLWAVYWLNTDPAEPHVSSFVREARLWSRNKIVPIGFWVSTIYDRWPLLALAVTGQAESDTDFEPLEHHLSASQQKDISDCVIATVRSELDKKSQRAWIDSFLTLKLGSGPKLAPLAEWEERLNLKRGVLLQMHTHRLTPGSASYNPAQVSRILKAISSNADETPSAFVADWIFYTKEDKWSVPEESLDEGQRVLERLTEKTLTQQDLAPSTIALFLKLLLVDERSLRIAPHLLNVLGQLYSELATFELSCNGWRLWQMFQTLPAGCKRQLLAYIADADPVTQVGARLLYVALLESYIVEGARRNAGPNAGRLRLGWQLVVSLLEEDDSRARRHGIMFLPALGLLVQEPGVQDRLLTAMARAQDKQEVDGWTRMLERVPIMNSSQREAWLSVFESMFSQPDRYVTDILAEAMNRYAVLSGEREPGLMSEAATLGLPSTASDSRAFRAV